jgi:hypothetical protein
MGGRFAVMPEISVVIWGKCDSRNATKRIITERRRNWSDARLFTASSVKIKKPRREKKWQVVLFELRQPLAAGSRQERIHGLG